MNLVCVVGEDAVQAFSLIAEGNSSRFIHYQIRTTPNDDVAGVAGNIRIRACGVVVVEIERVLVLRSRCK